jgi:hypothetical protein
MVITILSLVLGLLMTLGGLTPNIANGILHSKLDQALNHPEHLRVKVHPEAPAFTLLNGQMAYLEVDARNFSLSEFPVESLALRVDRLNVDTDAMQLRQPTQGVLRLRINETGVNRFLQSDTFKVMLENLLKKQELLASFGADLTIQRLDLQKGRLVLTGKANTMGGFFTIPFEVASGFRLGSERTLVATGAQAITLDQPVSADILQSILKEINPVLDLSQQLSTPEMQFYFRELHLLDDAIELVAEAEVKQLPSFD